MKVILQTRDKSLISAIFDELPPDGVTVSFEQKSQKGIIDTSDIVTIAISTLVSVPTSLFANWLWSKIKSTNQLNTNIVINNKKVEIRKTTIYQALHAHCDFEDDKDL